MGLEADDGRPETSPPLRRGVQTADRAVVRERQAIPGDQGRARHRAIDPAALGPGHPRQRLRPGRGQPHARAERAGRAGEAQQAVGDGGGRFRTSGAGIRTKAGVIRADAARCPISARCGIPDVPRPTCYWMTGRPGTERADPIAGDVRAVWRDGRERYGAGKIKAALERKGCHRVQETHRQHHARTGHDERVRARTVRTAQDAGRRGQAREPAGPRVRRLRPAHASGGRSYLCPRRRRLGVRVSAGRPGEQGHRRPFRRADPGRGPGIGRVRHPRLPPDRGGGFHTDRGGGFDDTRIDELLDVFGIKRSLSRKGNPYDNAVVESTDRLLRKELVYRNHYATVGQLRRGPDGYVWWSDDQRLHSTLGYRSPKEFTEQGLVL